MAKLISEDFYGCVYLKETLAHYDGKYYSGVIGMISILKDKDMVGFEVHKSESNWCARVSSISDRISINILGCQIRAVGIFDEKPKDVCTQFLVLE